MKNQMSLESAPVKTPVEEISETHELILKQLYFIGYELAIIAMILAIQLFK